MSIEDLFDHTCDIYHLLKDDKSPGYNLPASSTFSHSQEAHVKALPCHFGIRTSNNSSMTQKEPQNDFTERTKLNLPINTDIRILDKVIDCETQLEYTVVAPPRNIRGHHIIAYIERVGSQKPL